MISKKELLEILRESPLHVLMDELELETIVESLLNNIAMQN
jgi:hypothetical protein